MDEFTVDGARKAANIISQLPEKERMRILARVQIISPDTFKLISENLILFDDLIHLTDKSVQILVRTIDPAVLGTALQGVTSDLLNHFLDNMSHNRASIIRDEILLKKDSIADQIDEARRSIVKIVDELRTSGLVRSNTPDDVWV